ncbi:MAG: tRNA 2-thiouridine(34) synthase MnmA [Gammaproteobacteria bacterium]|nr:tRNA 2-thiouridine(34) synthase MnmA [Gammaproteobacteria bacterium]
MNTTSTKKHIIVGLSGGVDSSVAALLLKQQGHHVEGVFMKNWEEDDTDSFCPASQDMADAARVCDMLGIEFTRINFSAEYWQKVFAHFLADYQAGLTPNPDILCNREIKFRAFLDYAKSRGADYIATGHYARCVQQDQQHQLLKGCDASKDQSYFLHALSQDQLAHSVFPLGELDKKTVRRIASEAGFANHAKKDSTGICFIGERKFKTFLTEYVRAQQGNIETPEGEVIGTHDGLMFYTMGQRQGLHIGGRKDSNGEPWYVVAKDPKRNALIVAQGQTHPMLYASGLIVKDVHWIHGTPAVLPQTLFAKTRYRQDDQTCMIEQLVHNQYKISFTTPQRAVTPGQSVVFYQGEQCLGGGIIIESLAWS